MFYTVYKTTNLVNGKFYVGKHKTKVLNDGYMGSGKLIRRAFNKYGIDNFKIEYLGVFDSEWKMNVAEKIYVVLDAEISYNLCPGGHGGFGYLNENNLNNSSKDMDVIGKKISNSLSGKKNRSASDRLKQRHKEGKVKYNTFEGRKHSEETKRKISEARNQKNILC